MNNKNRPVQLASEDSTPESRKKEIENIKEEMNRLNKKMENFSFRKPEDSGEAKPYFQLATRKGNPNQPTNPPSSGDTNLNFFRTYSTNSASTSSTSS